MIEEPESKSKRGILVIALIVVIAVALSAAFIYTQYYQNLNSTEKITVPVGGFIANVSDVNLYYFGFNGTHLEFSLLNMTSTGSIEVWVQYNATQTVAISIGAIQMPVLYHVTIDNDARLIYYTNVVP